jgi:DNA-binding GntR family transcriptional regulator
MTKDDLDGTTTVAGRASSVGRGKDFEATDIPPGGGLQRDLAYDTIRGRILAGETGFQMGDWISENIIVGHFPELGRTPVRQALARLKEDWLVEPMARVGHRVRMVRGEDIRAIMGARFQLETVNVCELAFNPPSNLAPIEHPLEAMREFASDAGARARSGEGIPMDLIVKFVDADVEFHAAISELAGGGMVTDFLRRASAQFRLFMVSEGFPSNPSSLVDLMTGVVDQHQEVLDAIRDRDPQRAREAIHSHIRLAITRWAPKAMDHVNAARRYNDQSQTLDLGGTRPTSDVIKLAKPAPKKKNG